MAKEALQGKHTIVDGKQKDRGANVVIGYEKPIRQLESYKE